ncbi:MAG: sensor histidine kinase [Nostoc sp.]
MPQIKVLKAILGFVLGFIFVVGLIENCCNNLQASQVQQIQNEKMVALGQLVAGLAHEINNPISFIYGNLQYAGQYVQDLVNMIEVYQQEYPKPTPKIQEIAQDIDLNFMIEDLQNLIGAMYRGYDRIREIVLALQHFSRHDEAEMKRVNIHEDIENTLVMLQHRLRQTADRPAIVVVKDYGNLPLVTCYASELNQVFMHLLNNAIDAIEEGVGNKFLEKGMGKVGSPLGIRGNGEWGVENQSSTPYSLLPTPQIRIHTEVTDLNMVKIAIADNGQGIEESLQSRLFDPFFTTKPVGKGSGLGLSISYQIIVQKHRGNITCTSSVGKGAEFAIEIPIEQPDI